MDSTDYAELANELRSAEFRESFHSHLSAFLDRVNHDLDQDHPTHEILRCLVNVCADNDPNRDVVAKDAELWDKLTTKKRINEDEVHQDRVVVLLTQFIRNTNNEKQFMESFHQHFSSTVIDLVQINDVDVYEWVLEYVHENIGVIIEKNELDFAFKLASDLVDVLERGNLDEESPLHISRTIADLLSFEEMPTGGLNIRIIRLLGYSEAKVNRFLFAASGCILSMKNYHSEKDLKFSIELIENVESGSTNSYITGACAINIGNYITSQEKLLEVKSLISSPSKFISNYFHNPVTDVVQVQSVHMLTNLMNNEVFVEPIIANISYVEAIAKIIVDNAKYYNEVFQVFLRFCNKLILKKSSSWQLTDLWKCVLSADNTEETGYLLLQAYLESPEPTDIEYLGQLVVNATDAPTSISFPLLLSKLKTLGMLCHKMEKNKLLREVVILNQNKVFSSQLKFLKELAQELTGDVPPVLRNNARFVCATTLTALGVLGVKGEKVDELREVCEKVALEKQ